MASKSVTDLKSLVHGLEKWFLKIQRPLPWRKTQDPYAVWLSEVMLQQTQVSVVLPYYDRFLKRYPTLNSLADASEDEVLTLWSGLGYYSRARNLKKGAEFLVHEHGGTFPRDVELVRQVPGIGPYTAGAVLSIAFDLAVPIVDGNVARVFSRFYKLEKPIEAKEGQQFLWQNAKAWVEKASHPRILNQALMELGATVCTKHNPRCQLCPLARECTAHLKDQVENYPIRKPKKQRVDLYWLSPILQKGDKVLLRKNPKGTWWAGLWDFPHVEINNQTQWRVKAGQLAKEWRSKNWTELGQVQHTVTHHRIRTLVTHFAVSEKIPRNKEIEEKWFSRDEFDTAPLSSLARKVLAALPE